MVGERLLDLRKDAYMTQKELAAKLKVTKATISSYENDKSEPPDITKIEIAKIFDVSVDYLLGLTNKPQADKDRDKYIKVPASLSKEDITFLKELIEFMASKNLSK